MNKGRVQLRWLIVLLACTTHVFSQNAETFTQRVQAILNRPEFKHASFGIEFYSLDTQQPVFRVNGEKLFTPGSTTKLLTEGTALHLLGADYRFHTKIYRTGPVDKKGVLNGDLILVASGDPNLSNRIQPDGTLAFEDEDHTYSMPQSKAVPGDPLMVIREFADQIAAKGIKKVTGRVLVDVSLFPEGDRELGTGVVISPISVNDNVIDITVTPGASEGAQPTIKIAPETPYLVFTNKMRTGKAGSDWNLEDPAEVPNPNGTVAVTLTGTAPLQGDTRLFGYPVPSPSLFAETALAQALRDKGISVALPAKSVSVDFSKLTPFYTAENAVAEHISPPLSEEVKVTLKVSHNLHASMTPFIVGSVVGKAKERIEQAGFDQEHDFLTKAGLDLSGASQADGAGGAASAFYTPDFMVRYLAYMAKQPDYPLFHKALPILGRDGTLADIQTKSPAAGHVSAKTGTYGALDKLNKRLMITGKGLAGYLTTASGQQLSFALYVNRVSVPLNDPMAAQTIAGQALGEIAAAAYALPIDKPTLESEASTSTTKSETYDVVIRNARVMDGSGNPWYHADLAIKGDRIAAIGNLSKAEAKKVIDAAGLVVSPGFIDTLGQSEGALLIDNRSLSKLSQGISSEITGEGGSIAPQTDKTLAPMKPFLDQYHLMVDWTTLDGYFKRLEKDGTPLNLGTYVGAAQVREAIIGDEDRAPTPQELEAMKALVAQAMKDGAMGVSTALIYPPGHYAKTEELIELAKVASQYGGLYASHMRSEGASEEAALQEAFRIGREANLPVEIFHMKVSGKQRWGWMTKMQGMIQSARAGGLDVEGSMYPYGAGGTALASSLPPWVADGGTAKLLERLKDPATRRKIAAEMAVDHSTWENLYHDCGGGSGVMVSSVTNPDLKKYTGKTIAQIATEQKNPEMDTLFDFILADKAQTSALYFMAGEPDIQTGLKQSWTSIGLDSSESSLDGPLFEAHTHPRGWGSMPRFLGHYCRDLKLLPMEECVRKITSLPAQRYHLQERGLLKTGNFADVAIWDPATILDRATYTEPNQVSEGVHYLFVNGKLEYENGQLTGVNAGQVLRGRGYKQ